MIDGFFFWLSDYDANFAQSLYIYLSRMPQALLQTILVTLGACAIALTVGFLMALAELSTRRWLALVAKTIIGIGQGIPLPPLVFLIYFVALSFSPVSPAGAGTLALGLFTIPYAASIFRGGIRSVPKGQLEVVEAMGMPSTLIIRRVIAPIALRVVLPSIGHLIIVTLLNSSFASVIGANELTGMSRNVVNTYFSTNLWLVVALTYFIIAFPMSRFFLALEHRLRR